MPRLTRQKGICPKLVLAIDIGTTYSAASFKLDLGSADNKQGSFQESRGIFQEVNRWPKQTHAGGKIPSAIYYDREGNPKLQGAETEDEQSIFQAEDAGWQKAEWWKLLLRPDYLMPLDSFEPASLPPEITVDKVFSDQMTYIRDNTRNFIIKSHTDGAELWDKLSTSMEIVLTAPSGWEGKHLQRMRQAAIKAGLVGLNDGRRVRFVSEGEAAIHYCLDCVKIRNQVQIGNTVVVCDAGGGTVDIGVYKINNISPISVEEMLKAGCYMAGGVCVTDTASKFIKSRLHGSLWDNPECILSAITLFEKQVKRHFTGTEEVMYLTLNGSKTSDEFCGVSRGRLMISRADMISFFEPSLRRVREGLENTVRGMTQAPNHIFVVGGFTESEYVFSELCKWAKVNKLKIAKPDDILSKAITHGALRWFDHSGVQYRIAKMHYGVEQDLPYSSDDVNMEGRPHFQNILGEERVRHAWCSVIGKNARIRNGQEHHSSFERAFGETEALTAEMDLYAYRWNDPPQFFRHVATSTISNNRDVDLSEGRLVEGFIYLGTVKGDLKECFKAEKWQKARTGKRYKKLHYDVCFCFSEIEIQVWLRWREDGRLKKGSATVAYDV